MDKSIKKWSAAWWFPRCRPLCPPAIPTPGCTQRLDISIGARTEFAALKVAPHGLLGQTFDGDNIAVDGAVDDYSPSVVVTKVCACLPRRLDTCRCVAFAPASTYRSRPKKQHSPGLKYHVALGVPQVAT